MKIATGTIKAVVIAIIALVAVNYVSSLAHQRFDLTQDKRYTLSDPAKDILDRVAEPLIIDVFLEGEFPAEFKKLQNETRYLLEEMNDFNDNIIFNFSNPVEEGSDPDFVAKQFADFGMQPVNLTVKTNGKETQERIFPYATANYKGRAVPIALFKNILGASREQVVYASIQNLEYEFMDGLNKLISEKSKRIGVLKGNGQLPNARVADLLEELNATYKVDNFPLSTVKTDPERTLGALQKFFDLIIVAKPTVAFTDEEKFVLDQYTMNGGNALWLVDAVAMETDSLRNDNGQTLSFPRELNLNDMFFKYGARINPVLIKDLYSAPLSVASGDGSQSRYQELPWFYQPLVTAPSTHPINTNIEKPIKFAYANQLEVLNNAKDIRKTVLLATSMLTQLEGVPKVISLDQIEMQPDPKAYAGGQQALAVLLEGSFESAFKNRVQPVKLKDIRFRESGEKPAKIVLIADGDVIANDLDPKGNPLELGFDYLTRTEYGNKEFLLNTVNYLLDDDGLINIRSKEIALPFLDVQKTGEELNKWQALTIGLPLVSLLIFGLVFYRLRKRKYAR